MVMVISTSTSCWDRFNQININGRDLKPAIKITATSPTSNYGLMEGRLQKGSKATNSSLGSEMDGVSCKTHYKLQSDHRRPFR